MYQIAQKFRYVFRWLVFSAASVAVIAAAFASALPFLIEGQTVRDSFIRSLSAWSGGPVTVKGPLRIASFTTLSIEASGVHFGTTPRLDPVKRIEAKSVTAVARLSSLLRGRLEFKQIAVEAPRFVFKRDAPAAKLPFYGMETAGTMLAFADRSPFERFELHDAAFFRAEGDRSPYIRTSVEHVRLDKRPPKDPSPSGDALDRGGQYVSLFIKDQGFEAAFRGDINRAEETALGMFRLKALEQHPATGRIIAAIAPWEQGHSVSISGDLTWSGERAALDNATAAFGDHGVKGSLGLAVRRGRALLEGTLAYDKLDLIAGGDETAGKAGAFLQPLRALILAHSGKKQSFDLDMRISAEHFQAGPFVAGPFAVALTSRQDRFSVDVAELTLFGGNVKGRLDYDPAKPPALTLDASALRLDAASLIEVLGWPLSVSGPANVKLNLEIPFADNRLSREAGEATGNFAISFPAGGTLRGEMSQRLNATLAHQDLSWMPGKSSLPFTAADIDGTTGANGTSLKIDGESGANRIGGSLRIASPGSVISGTLSVTPQEAAAGTALPASPPSDTPKLANIVLSGTLAALNFSSSGKADFSN